MAAPIHTLARYALELGTSIAGFLHRFEGGDVAADVIAETLDPDGIVRKHLGGIKYEDIALAFGADMSDSVYDWIATTLGRMDRSQDGAIVAVDMNLQARSRLEFSGALIREITFPALDASSRAAALIEIKFAPELTRSRQASGRISTNARQSRQWDRANFRLQIDGLDCSRVNAIDALKISRDLASVAMGSTRVYQRIPGALEIPNLAFTIDESGADSLIAWHEDFVIRGNNGAGAERNGTLQFLSHNLQDTLFTLTLRNLGIFKLALEKMDESSGAVRRLRAEMYCEEIGFQYAGAASAGAQDGRAAGAGAQDGRAAGAGAQDGRAGTTSSGASTVGAGAATQNGGRTPLRGVDLRALATMAASRSATARLAQPPSREPVTNARNPGRPFKFRT